MSTIDQRSAGNRSELKHRAIQQAGTDVFLELGYSAATMDLIAERAGVSKQTVYNHFQSKDRLFKSTIADMTADLLAPLTLRDRSKSTPRELLFGLSRQLLTLMLQPSSLALYRLIMSETARFPELGAEIYTVGAGQMQARLADYLAWETGNGRLAVDNPQWAAEQFVGMLTGRLQLRALLGVVPLPDPPELERRAAYAVDCFLAIHVCRLPQAGAAAG